MFVASEAKDGMWIVRLKEIPFNGEGRIVECGSYNILPARLMGFTYVQYLKYCVANFNAVLCGREGYSYCLYKTKADCHKACVVINKYWRKFIEGIGETR